MQMQSDVSLQPFNTFGLSAQAKMFSAARSLEDILEIFNDDQLRAMPRLILGGGSNILLTQDFDGLVLKNELKGITVIKEDDEHVWIKVGAGENWHQLVLHCINQGWAGVENLSLIPGCVGAGPMQNIGAYGVELKNIFHELEALHIDSRQVQNFNGEACQFGYRESVFKRALKGQHVITAVTLKLDKSPTFNTSYGAIEQELERMGVQVLSIKAISDAVINIRQSKLPDPAEIGNSGSFFKNPVVSTAQFQTIKESFPEAVGYAVSDTHTKLAAGWLIDRAGWKGKTIDNYGVHKKQALVLVNYGGAKGNDIYQLSEDIMASIKDTFGVSLEREVNII